MEAGTLRAVYRGSYRRPYRDDPPPRRDLLPRRGFLTTTSLIATRGCHNRCGFCYLATDGLAMPYQVRDVEQVVAEFRADGQPYGVFIDNNLGSRPDYLRSLCHALRPLEVIWSAAVTIDVTDDPSLVRDMALAGCTGVFVGFESLSDENLSDARKKTPSAADYARRVAMLHDHGIQVNGSFVLGFDHDRRDVFERTVDWIEEARLECATFHILTPYPGTPLFRQMESEGRLLHRDWSLYDTAHVVFRPRHMTPEELAEGYAWCYERLFSHGSIWRRRPDDWRAVPPYLAMSYLYKRSNRLWHLLIRHRLTGPGVAAAGRVDAAAAPAIPAAAGVADRPRRDARWRARWSPPGSEATRDRSHRVATGSALMTASTSSRARRKDPWSWMSTRRRSGSPGSGWRDASTTRTPGSSLRARRTTRRPISPLAPRTRSVFMRGLLARCGRSASRVGDPRGSDVQIDCQGDRIGSP